MGRTLQALSRAKPSARRVDVPAPIPEPVAEVEVEVEPEVPFIEIGPRGTPMHASALVLATGPLPVPKKAASPTTALVVKGPMSPKTEAAPLTVAFQVLPDEPAVAFASELITFHQPDHAVSNQYRELLASLRKTLPARSSHVLLFVPTASAIGATTAVLNLAITAAREANVRVGLVDANFPAPGMAARLGLSEAPGFKEVVTGRIGLDQAVRETGQDGLRILTTGSTAVGKDVISLAGMAAPLLGELRAEFDLLLVEAPAWQTGGIPALAAAGDALFVVLPQDAANLAATKELLRAVRRQARRPNGMILTQ